MAHHDSRPENKGREMRWKGKDGDKHKISHTTLPPREFLGQQ